MNKKLRAQHTESLNDQKALQMYDALCEACDLREGGMTDADQMLVADIARFEQIKQQMIRDIEENGLGQERRNGRQTYWQENKSVGQLRQYAEQQRKHLAELRLTPNGRKAAAIDVDDDFARY